MLLEILQVERPVVGAGILLTWLLWRLSCLLERYQVVKKQRGVRVAEWPTAFGRWLFGYRYLRTGPDDLSNAYSHDQPVAVRCPENYYLHLSSAQHVKELMDAAEDKLSLHAQSKDLMQIKYTMNGLEIDDNTSANGKVHLRVLMIMLRSHLPDLFPTMQRNFATAFSAVQAELKGSDGWTSAPALATAQRLVVSMNSLAFFGEELSSNEEFLQAALQYPNDLNITAETARLVPAFLRPILCPIFMRKHRATSVMVKYLQPVMAQRYEEKRAGAGPRHLDCIQWFIDASERDGWDERKLIQVMLGIWYASIHQPALALVNALEDLCSYPELREPLQRELDTCDGTLKSLDSLPLLDSFLRESARLNPADSISVRRKCLQPHTFSGGIHISPGDVACVPLRAIQLDPENYPESQRFDPWRFIDRKTEKNTDRFIEASPIYPLWGLGKHACPGRHLANAVLKLAVTHVLQNYEVRTDGTPQGKRKMYWRSAIVPRPGFCFQFKKLD